MRFHSGLLLVWQSEDNFFSAQLFSPQSLLNERKTRPMWTLQRTMETWDSGEWWAMYLAVACIYWRLHSIKLSAHLSFHFLSLTLKPYRSETLLGTMNNPPKTRAPNPITVSYCCVDVRWRGDKSLFVQWLNMCCFEFQTHVRRHKSEQNFFSLFREKSLEHYQSAGHVVGAVKAHLELGQYFAASGMVQDLVPGDPNLPVS